MQGEQPQGPLCGDPAGIEQITRRSFRYSRRTIKDLAVYKEAIDPLLGDIKGCGFELLLVVGKSDNDFAADYACTNHGACYLTHDPVEEDAV